MDGLLSISKFKPIIEIQDDDTILAAQSLSDTSKIVVKPTIERFSSANRVLEVLQDKPSFEILHSCLKRLSKPDDVFNVRIPGPLSTQVISALVNEIIPAYWTILRDESHQKERRWLLGCLTSISGLAALVARLRMLIGTKSSSSPTTDHPENGGAEMLEVLDSLLHGSHVLLDIWSDLQGNIQKPLQRQLLWKELGSLLGSGRLVSVAAETLILLQDRESRFSWLGNSAAFSKWLGDNIGTLAVGSDKHGREVFASAASMLGRGLSLGHPDTLVEASFQSLVRGNTLHDGAELDLFDHLSTTDRTKAFSAALSILSKIFSASNKSSHLKLISGASALIKVLLDRQSHLQQFLMNWLACFSGGCVGTELGMRRAAVATISSYEGSIQESLRQLLVQFGDKIHIQHAPILVQEVCTQNLLLLVGRVYRKDRIMLKNIARSSIFINAISNRLASSSERPRFLGMIVGTSVSELVDSADKRMNFTDLSRFSDTEWYMQLTGIQDEIGTRSDLVQGGDTDAVINTTRDTSKSRLKPSTAKKPPSKQTTTKIVSIQEISSDDDDIPRYEKPDSDAEDSDEDPTLINRNKPTPPVYIRDLITYLRDTENYDRHVLAMSHAASLIRRKSSFGTEVIDHIGDLASLLCGLKDEHDIESWQQQRIAALVAIILAQPSSMGKWFANSVFSGDYSVSQRATLLTAITLAARELAGYASEDAELTKAPESSEQLFPSKQLPARYAKLYTQSTSAITSAARDLENKMLQPLAAEALDKTTNAPSILKTRTFSSRLAVESRKKPINNKLSTLLAEQFFFPLTNRWRVYMQTHSSNSNGNIFSTPFLHAHLLKTLSLLLAAAGSSTLSLPSLTTEFWTILLSPSTRVSASSALPVLEAVLFGLLTLLDINGAGMEGEDRSKRRLAEECGEELIETRAWVGVIMEGFAGRGNGLGEEEERIRMLAAGVLTRVEEVIDRYQRLLMGALAGI